MLYVLLYNQYFFISCFSNSFGIVQLHCSLIRNMFSLSNLILLFSLRLRGLLIKIHALYHYNDETFCFHCYSSCSFMSTFHIWSLFVVQIILSFSKLSIVAWKCSSFLYEYSLFIQKRECSRKFLHNSNCWTIFRIFFWPRPQPEEVSWPGIEPEPQQWQCGILNLLSHQGTPSF